MNASYLKKLEMIEKRFCELEALLSDLKVIGNPQEFKKLSKERAEYQEVVGYYREYRKLLSEIASNEHLLLEKDKEIQLLAKAELQTLVAQKGPLEKKLEVLLLPKDPNDDKNIFLEIRAGTGGDEASLFSADLFRMYSKFAESKG